MSVFKLRDTIVATAASLLGVNEADGSAWEKVISPYNNEIIPRPRGYVMLPTDSWCAAFVSLVMHRAGVPGFPYECGVGNMWELAIQDGLTIQGRCPMFGDVAVYTHSHVGIVKSFRGGVLTTIEGNANDKCMERTTTDISKFRGFFRPYKPVLREAALEVIKGVYTSDMETRKKLLQADGWDYTGVQLEVNKVMHAVQLATVYNIPIEDKELEAIALNIHGEADAIG